MYTLPNHLVVIDRDKLMSFYVGAIYKQDLHALLKHFSISDSYMKLEMRGKVIEESWSGIKTYNQMELYRIFLYLPNKPYESIVHH